MTRNEEVAEVLESEGLGRIMFGCGGPYDVDEMEANGTIVVSPPGGALFGVPTVVPGEYIAYAGFVSGSRGIASVVHARNAIRDFFASSDGSVLWAKTLKSNTHSIRNLCALGFTLREEMFVVGRMDYYDWAAGSRECRDAGLALCKELGVDIPIDVAHHLGAFIMTVRAGLPGKAVVNWRKYAQLNEMPDIIMMDAEGSEFEILGNVIRLGA